MPTQTGLIFNIQKFSLHDGPGIRTLVFFKGCPLRCLWCCNPESQNPEPEHGYDPGKCFGCGRCVARCAKGVLSLKADSTLDIRRGLCRAECPACVRVCPDQALVFYGRTYTVPEVLDVAEQDAPFYSRSGGGLSVSGGEPFMQPDFLIQLLTEARIPLLKDFLFASTFTGLAFGTAGCAAVHALSYPLGGTCHVPHGESNYALFTQVLKAYRRARSGGALQALLLFLAPFLDCQPDYVPDGLDQLLAAVLPLKRLREFGMAEQDIPAFAQTVLATQQRLLANNCVPLSELQIRDIYRARW